MNKLITNITDGIVLTDPRYGHVVALDGSEAPALQKLDVAFARVNPGATSPNHYHVFTEEVYAITKGAGMMTINGITSPIKLGDVVRIPVYTTHSIIAGPDGVEFFVSTTPPYTDGDDHETDATIIEKPTLTSLPIAIIIGTHRKDSMSAKVARQIAKMYSKLGVSTDVIDPADLPANTFSPESFDHRYETDSPLTKRLIAAAGLHFIVPEYNGSFPGILKHILDIQPYKNCFDGKPVAFVGVAAGEWGGTRAVDQLSQVLAYRNSHLFGGRVYIKEIDEAPLDDAGRLTNPEITARMERQVNDFSEFVKSIHRQI